MVNFTLSGLNQTFQLGVSGELAAEAPATFDVSAIAIFNVKLSDMSGVFQFQSDSFDVNDTDASDIKYYVDMNLWPTKLVLNPAHAHTLTSTPILETSADILAAKNLVKHDFVRYLALHLFNTPHGVDLFSNEDALLADIVSKGSTAFASIKTALNAVNKTNAVGGGAAGSKYSTNDLSNNTNFSRELLRQVASVAPARFHGMQGVSTAQPVPLAVDDTISFKVTINAAAGQHSLTGRSEFNARVYQIKLVLKDDADATNVAPLELNTGSEYPYHP